MISSCAAPKQADDFKTMNQGELVNRQFLVTVPYTYSSDSAILIDVVIKKAHFKFMLDTGAPLAISKSLQKQLNFPLLSKNNLRDANGDATSVEIVATDDLTISGLQFSGVPALVLDFPPLPFECDHIDGLIGSNLLRFLIVKYNKQEQEIVFSDNIEKIIPGADAISMPLYLDPVQSDPHIALTVDGKFIDTVLFDTGDKAMYRISKYIFDRFNNTGALIKKIAAEGTGISSGGIVAANTDSLTSFLYNADLSIGNATIQNILTEPNYSNQSRVGRGLFNYGLVTMDYPSGKFYFLPHQGAIQFQNEPGFGFQYGERNNQLLVTQVWKNTTAFECGLQPGNQILQLGSFVPSSHSRCEWEPNCRKEAKEGFLNIKFMDREGSVKTCRLTKVVF